MMMDKAEEEIIIYTPREAILHSAEFLPKRNHVIHVRGEVVLVDLERQRLDLAHQGAKLIVRLLEYPPGIILVDDNDADTSRRVSETSTVVQKGSIVTVKGTLRKEQRRTFLQAISLSVCKEE